MATGNKTLNIDKTKGLKKEIKHIVTKEEAEICKKSLEAKGYEVSCNKLQDVQYNSTSVNVKNKFTVRINSSGKTVASDSAESMEGIYALIKQFDAQLQKTENLKDEK